jgi:hypothetical protein
MRLVRFRAVPVFSRYALPALVSRFNAAMLRRVLYGLLCGWWGLLDVAVTVTAGVRARRRLRGGRRGRGCRSFGNGFMPLFASCRECLRDDDGRLDICPGFAVMTYRRPRRRVFLRTRSAILTIGILLPVAAVCTSLNGFVFLRLAGGFRCVALPSLHRRCR